MKRLLQACLAVALLLPSAALANLGVGIGTGKIVMAEPLKPGGIYVLSPVMVLNTGDQPSGYGLEVQYNERQDELKPDASWFRFAPDSFDLDPGKSKAVVTTLTLPVGARPGHYFAYLEAYPVLRQEVGVSHVGIAAATKLYFEVAPANLFMAIWYRASSKLKSYQPWTDVILVILAIALAYAVLRRFVSLNISFRKPNAKS